MITTSADYAASVYAADLDGDGDLDVLSASWDDDKIAWYENTSNVALTPPITVTKPNGGDTLYADSAALITWESHTVEFVDLAYSIDEGSTWTTIASDVSAAWGSYPWTVAHPATTKQTLVRVSDASDATVSDESDSAFTIYVDIFGAQQVITTSADVAYSVHAADLDGDGDYDVLSASAFDDKIAWYENDGSGNFGAQQVITTSADGAESVYAADLDGDGDYDVLSASYMDDKIAWYENDGSGNFGEQQVITTSADGAASVHAADLDGDGDLDVLSASGNDDKIAWYENDGIGNFGAEQVITTSADRAESVHAADLDGDGDIDVLSASLSDDKIAWYENDGSGNFGEQQVITTSADGAASVYAADLDGDGDIDVLSASTYDDKIAWYENDGIGNFGAEQVITTSADRAESVYAADLDGDGDYDVLSASKYDDKIAWYENDGSGNFGEQQVITTSAAGAASVYAADLDGDGDIDVLSASTYDDKIAWYENISNVALTPPITVTKPNGGDTLYADSAALITWESHTVEFVDLAYSIDEGSTWTTIASDVSAAWGSYPWTVGRVNTASALVRVSDAADGTVVDESDAGFTIIGPEIVLQSPNGGEIWEVGSEQTIRWTSVNIDSVAIDFSYDGGATWTDLATLPSTDTSYTWTFPTTPTTEALVRITDAADSTLFDQSDASFTLYERTITLLYPNGGEIWEVGSEQTIRWTSVNIDSVAISFSADSGATWTDLATLPSTDTSYTWTFPTTPTTEALVRITDAADSTLFDQSDASFTLYERTITLLYPNGGEIWEVGSEQTIRWTSVNIDSVAIDFSYDGGASWNEYVVVSGSDTSYSETVGAVTTLSAKIRVRDNADETISDVSDSTFTIQDPTGLTALGIPDEFGLSQNYPNPFNPATTIRYALPEAATVRLAIFNALGQAVRELEASAKQPGYHETSFNASELGSGVYFYRIDALGASGERFQETRKMLLVK